MTVLLTAQELSKSYGHRQLFAGLSFDLRAGEKVGLVGPNGAGKTTLLKILAGLEHADTGVRSCRRGVCIGYLPQDEAFPAGQTARQVVLDALASDNLEEHERQTRAAISVTQVGFTDLDALADSHSGGWRKRLALARELARRPDFLLLDEPTNHLDLPGVVWLERLLKGAPFGFLVATHDRAFLRAIANEVIEVNRAYPDGVFRSDGGYEDFVQKRELFLEAQARQQNSLANQVRRETEWLSRKESAQRRKSRAMIEAAADHREDLADLKQRNATAQTAAIDFAGTGRQTRKLLTANGITKSLGGKPLFANLDLTLTPGSKIGLLGPNGSGKSTLLRVLAGELAPDAGTVVYADGLQSEFFEQARASLDPSKTLRRALFPGGDNLMFRGQPMHVIAWAKRFLFQPEQLDLELNALSGGEQARVRIAQLMLRTADLLLLDEPTNDLDIPALEVLEDSLADFPGALVLVSHDRDLLDRLCTEFVGLDGRGSASVFGSVSQWLTAYENATTAAKPVATAASKPTTVPRSTKPRRLSYKEQQEWDGMEAAILSAEEVLAARHGDVERAAAAGHAALAAACHTLEEAQRAVEQLYSRWQELEARRGQ